MLLSTLGFVLGIGCVGEPPDLTPAEREALHDYIATEAPSPQHELDIRFESRVRLIGYDISTEQITPGQAFDITWYWQVDRRLTDGWLLFTHLADAAGENRCNADGPAALEAARCCDVAPVRGSYPPSRWREGEWVRDVQHITIPADWHSDQVTFYLGFWSPDQNTSGPDRDHRLIVTHGPSDGDRRARAATISIAGGAHASLSIRTATASGHGA